MREGDNPQHIDHHDGENLQRIAGHVHHNRLHWYLLRRAQSNFPGLLQLESVHFQFGRRLAGGDLCFLFHVSIAPGFVGSPLCKSMTHLGGGGGVVPLAIVKVLLESMIAEDKSGYRDM